MNGGVHFPLRRLIREEPPSVSARPSSPRGGARGVLGLERTLRQADPVDSPRSRQNSANLGLHVVRIGSAQTKV